MDDLVGINLDDVLDVLVDFFERFIDGPDAVDFSAETIELPTLESSSEPPVSNDALELPADTSRGDPFLQNLLNDPSQPVFGPVVLPNPYSAMP